MNDNALDDRAVEALCEKLVADVRAGHTSHIQAQEKLILALCNYLRNCAETGEPIYRYTLRRVDGTMAQLAALHPA